MKNVSADLSIGDSRQGGFNNVCLQLGVKRNSEQMAHHKWKKNCPWWFDALSHIQ